VILTIALRQARLVLGWVTTDHPRVGKPSWSVASHLGQLSLLSSVGQ